MTPADTKCPWCKRMGPGYDEAIKPVYPEHCRHGKQISLTAVGIDAALANMGFATVRITGDDARHLQVECLGLALQQTEGDGKRRVVRKSSEELRRAKDLVSAVQEACRGHAFAFVEVPSGSQSAAAARSLGIAVGVLASCPIPIIEVNPMEVKAVVAGQRVKKGATKAEIVAWAAEKWPDAPWLRATHAARSKGVLLPAGRLLADNEHCADAMASVLAGIATPEFQRLMVLHETTRTPDIRPAPRRERVRIL